jgi:hypothetical protein
MKHAFLGLTVFLAAAVWGFASGASEEGVFTSTGIDSVSVKAEFLDVEVKADDGFDVSLTSELPADSPLEPRGYRLLHEVVGSRLNVWIEKDSPFSGVGRGGKLTLQVPRSASMKIETVSGRITAEGMETRNLSVKTISGRLRLHNIRGVLEATSVSGEIVVDSMEGSISAKAVSGSIEGRNVSLTEDSSFSTVSGNIDVELASAIDNLAFDLSSQSGRIVVGSIKAVRGLRMGEGGTLVRAHSVSGSLSFQ